ncbi:hsp70 family protein [Vibrio ulleungensis]|uniref:Hsp70 family protein n=1 Tax=Vibrio ulleungensis TaxID=2807619 RepID=A0ABS2HGU8_9VIBR|nr:hsp70 family protein [Vibrio ulleungensis]MBM7035886.1 Hsp70 family protein [Vibrio ulleungensis]
MSRPAYLVGIDLGTTHCVVAFASIDANPNEPINLLPIPQLIGPGQVADRLSLPSFRFHPHSTQFSVADLTLPWQQQPVLGDEQPAIIGEWARELGTHSPSQLVSSAKSWLSHDKVDRHDSILPWIASEETHRISPVIASASYLNYLRQAWDHQHPVHKLAEQKLTITIPASFDEAARKLTLEGAALAGLHNVTLLEEPQAACYDWVARSQQDAEQQLKEHASILVVDVGGGTTDLSLIATHDHNNNFELNRVAVGEHLMLGGDNIDLAIAHLAERSLNNNARMNTANLSKLAQQARKTKELLLGDNELTESKITLLGSGSKLIGASRSTSVTKSDLHQLALDGFFPLTDIDTLPSTKRGAIVEFGLPFVSDPAISKHIAQFLAQHQQQTGLPTAVLYNGGLFNSALVAKRVTELLSSWSSREVTVLENPHPDHSVAYGAVAFLQAKQGKLATIKSGASRSFYLHLPSKSGPGRALCLLKKGEMPGTEVKLTGRTFNLTINQPARFHVLSAHQEILIKQNEVAHGQIIDVVNAPLHPLPALVTTISDKSIDANNVDVQLITQQTEIGTIKLECQSLVSDHRWELEFDTRQHANPDSDGAPSPQLKTANQLISQAFSGNRKISDGKEIKTLTRHLEKQLGNKDDWSFNTLRSIYDTLQQGRKRRRRSDRHEQVWLRLAGHTLRPGFGDVNDSWRIEQLWALNQHTLQFPSTQSWNDWWTLWRRVAGGLNQEQQEQLLTQLAPFLHPGAVSSKQGRERAHQHGYESMVRLAASLEQLEAEDKLLLGNWFFKRATQQKDHVATHWWAVARIGTRFSMQQSQQKLLPKSTVEAWLTSLLALSWDKSDGIAFCASMLAANVADRELVVSDSLQQQVIARLQQVKAPASWISMVANVQQLDSESQAKALGDTLPSGLKLVS